MPWKPDWFRYSNRMWGDRMEILTIIAIVANAIAILVCGGASIVHVMNNRLSMAILCFLLAIINLLFLSLNIIRLRGL